MRLKEFFREPKTWLFLVAIAYTSFCVVISEEILISILFIAATILYLFGLYIIYKKTRK